MARIASQNFRAVQETTSLLEAFKMSLQTSKKPWDSIIEFATHPSFCDMKLYPRQQTLLKLIYLETEFMSAYDLEVIENWRQNFVRKKNVFGVQPDVWERVEWLKENHYTHFPHIEAVQGRRASKGLVGGILGAERISHMITLDNPQEFYGINSDSIYLMSVATNSLQAKRFLFADIRSTVEGNKWLARYISQSKEMSLSLRTPADVRKIAELHSRKVPLDHEIASVRALAMSSNSASGRGAAAFMMGYDEFAHMIQGTGGQRDSTEVYEAYQPSLDQFGSDALTYIPSSPWTKVGKFYELYQAGSALMRSYLLKIGQVSLAEEYEDMDGEEAFSQVTADPEMLIIQLPSWELYLDYERGAELVGINFKRPIQVPPIGNLPENLKMARLKQRNPEKFKVEREAQFGEVLDAYLNADKVDQMFDPFWVGTEEYPEGRILEPLMHGSSFKYQAHADPSKSNANFAVAVGHLEVSPVPDYLTDKYGQEKAVYWPHVVIDYMNVWKPSDFPDGIIDYIQVTKELGDLVAGFPTMDVFTLDQWNSASILAETRKRFPHLRVREETFTSASTFKLAEDFKSALNLGWVHSYRDNFYGSLEEREEGLGQSLLELECKFLSEKNGKVIKQESGPVTTKDLFDAVSVVTTRLLKDSLGRWYTEILGRQPLTTGSQGGHPNSILGDVPQQGGARRALSELSRGRRFDQGANPARGRRDPGVSGGVPNRQGWGRRY